MIDLLTRQAPVSSAEALKRATTRQLTAKYSKLNPVSEVAWLRTKSSNKLNAKTQRVYLVVFGIHFTSPKKQRLHDLKDEPRQWESGVCLCICSPLGRSLLHSFQVLRTIPFHLPKAWIISLQLCFPLLVIHCQSNSFPLVSFKLLIALQSSGGACACPAKRLHVSGPSETKLLKPGCWLSSGGFSAHASRWQISTPLPPSERSYPLDR